MSKDNECSVIGDKCCILVTGGAGYIGSHCVLNLLEAGYDVAVFDNLSTGHRRFIDVFRNEASKKDCPGDFIGLIEGDLMVPEEIDHALSSERFDAIIHLAARSQVPESVCDPAIYYRCNVVGTMNLMDSMRRNEVDRVVSASSAAVYGDSGLAAVSEDAPLSPMNPYGASKVMMERVLEDYGNAYGIHCVSLRCFNVVGADSFSRVGECHRPETHLIPRILDSGLGRAGPFRIFGNDRRTPDGTCVRDYVDVRDVAEAFRLALSYADRAQPNSIFNIGTGAGRSVKDVFDTCQWLIGHEIPTIRIEGNERIGDPDSLVSDSVKASNILKWQPSRLLDDSILSTIAWMRKHQVEGSGDPRCMTGDTHVRF